MLTDRRARELLWPLYAMACVIQDGVPKDQREEPDYVLFMDRLKVAEAEIRALHGKSPKEWDKVVFSTMRSVGDAVKTYVKADAEVGKVGLIVFYVLQVLVETGYLVYSEGSAVDDALRLYMGAIDHHAEVEKKRRSAEKQAAHMLRTLQRLGYYRDLKTAEAS